MFFDDWIDGNSISRDPRIYIDGWSYPSRKHLQDAFSKFPTSKIYQKPFLENLLLGFQDESTNFYGLLSPCGLNDGAVGLADT